MAKRKTITKEDIFIKARMISEGVCLQEKLEDLPPELRGISVKDSELNLSENIEVPNKLDFSDTGKLMELSYLSRAQSSTNRFLSNTLILDKSDLKAPIYPNKHSRLDLSIEDETVSISDGGKELATGHFPKRFEWLDSKLSNGLPIVAALPAASAGIINIVFTLSCMNYNTNRGCRYCNLFANPISRKISMLPKETLRGWSKYQAEAVKIAINAGWRGNIALSGGALAPAQRKEYLERLEIVINMLREAVGEGVMSELRLVYNHFPPENFADMEKWKEIGVDATSIDLEVMDSAYFAAICPGKNAYKPHEYWKKAQEASVDIFGPLFNTTGCIVMGIEPMSTLIEGIDERLSKGIMPIPLVFYSAPGSAYWGFRAPTAEWIVEASEKIADSFMKHSPKFLARAMAKARRKRTPRQSTHLTIVFDEIQRRIQELRRK